MIVGEAFSFGQADSGKSKRGLFPFVTSVKPEAGAPDLILSQNYGADTKFAVRQADIVPAEATSLALRQNGVFMKPDEVVVTNANRGELKIVPPFRQRREKVASVRFDRPKAAMFQKKDEDVVAVTRWSSVPGIIPAEDIRQEWPPFGPEYPGEDTLVMDQPTGAAEARYDLLSDTLRVSDVATIGGLGISLPPLVSVAPTAPAPAPTAPAEPGFFDKLLTAVTAAAPKIVEKVAEVKALKKLTKAPAPVAPPPPAPVYPAQTTGTPTWVWLAVGGVGIAALGVLGIALMKRRS